jgi:hypothetical protein
MAEARVTNPLVEQFRKGGVPRELRHMAAQGALPLKPEDLLELWTDLVADADAEVQAAASHSFKTFPAAELLPILKSRETPSRVLAWGLRHRTERDLREAALQNTSLADEAIQELVPSLPTELAELVVINQTRLLRSTPLLEAVESNPTLSNDQRRRLRELRETFRIGAEPEAPPPPQAPRPPEPEPELAPLHLDLTAEEAMVTILSEEERQNAEKVSTVQKLYRMNTAEKIIAALKGNREERAILVRDPNRLVATAVIGSPRLTDSEIESFSSMKNVSDEILRTIGKHKEWTKKYGVVANLVRNPRTPIGISMTLVPRLNPRDIKSVAVDKNVPEAIRKAASRFVKDPQKKG